MIRILLSTELGKRRWSQADLARMTGIRASTIGDYYNELTDRINLRHFELICKALDCDLTDILVYHPDEDTPVKSRSGAPLHEPQGISHAPQNKRRSVLMSECLLFFSKNLLGMAPLLSTCIQGGTAVRHILFHLMFFVQCIPHFGGCNPHTRAILGLLHHIFLFPLTSPFRPRIHPGLFLFPPHPRWSNLAPDKSAQ